MLKTFFSLTLVLILITSCENRVCPPDYYTWSYYDKDDPKQGEWAGSLFRYHFWVNDDSIFVQSLSNKKCNILNELGEIVGSSNFDTTQINSTLIAVKSLPTLWVNKVVINDSSQISNVNYLSFPIEKTSLLSGRLPKREHGIEYHIRGRKRYIKFSMESSGKCIYDIRQYDATKFLMSIRGKIENIHNHEQHYVVMIDFEDLSRRRFLGIKL